MDVEIHVLLIAVIIFHSAAIARRFSSRHIASLRDLRLRHGDVFILELAPDSRIAVTCFLFILTPTTDF